MTAAKSLSSRRSPGVDAAIAFAYCLACASVPAQDPTPESRATPFESRHFDFVVEEGGPVIDGVGLVASTALEVNPAGPETHLVAIASAVNGCPGVGATYDGRFAKGLTKQARGNEGSFAVLEQVVRKPCVIQLHGFVEGAFPHPIRTGTVHVEVRFVHETHESLERYESCSDLRQTLLDALKKSDADAIEKAASAITETLDGAPIESSKRLAEFVVSLLEDDRRGRTAPLMNVSERFIRAALRFYERAYPPGTRELHDATMIAAVSLARIAPLGEAIALAEEELARLKDGFGFAPGDRTRVLHLIADWKAASGDGAGAARARREIVELASAPHDNSSWLPRDPSITSERKKFLSRGAFAEVIELSRVFVAEETKGGRSDSWEVDDARVDEAIALAALGDRKAARSILEVVSSRVARHKFGGIGGLFAPFQAVREARRRLAWLDVTEGTATTESLRRLFAPEEFGRSFGDRLFFGTGSSPDAWRANRGPGVGEALALHRHVGPSDAASEDLASFAFLIGEMDRDDVWSDSMLRRFAERFAAVERGREVSAARVALRLDKIYGAVLEEPYWQTSNPDWTFESARDLCRFVPNGVGLLREPTVEYVRSQIPADEVYVAWTVVAEAPSPFTGFDMTSSAGAAPPARMQAFVVTKADGLSIVDLGETTAISDAIGRWRAALEEGRTDVAAADAVYKLVLEPIAPRFKGMRTIAYAPDGALHGVPIDALPYDGALLGDRFETIVRRTAREYAFVDRSTSLRWELWLLADPAYAADTEEPPIKRKSGSSNFSGSGGGFGPEVVLNVGVRADVIPRDEARAFEARPDSLLEMDVVQRVFRRAFEGGDVVRTTGTDARRSRMANAARGARFAHLCTHAFVAPESKPILGLVDGDKGETVRWEYSYRACGVALAGVASERAAKTGDRGFSASQIADLDLMGCDLAVLSGGPPRRNADRSALAIKTLQDAFFRAGAKSVITALWRVPEESSRAFFAEFYRLLWIEKSPKAAAMREAKRIMREAKNEAGEAKFKTRDWAAWVLTGDPR